MAEIKPPFFAWEEDEFLLLLLRSETTIPKPPVSSSFFCGASLFISVLTSSFALIGSCFLTTVRVLLFSVKSFFSSGSW
jgi:hypothetical protein